MQITVTGGEMTEKEQQEYVNHIRKNNPDKVIRKLEIRLDGEFVDLRYEYETVPFECIRRITGYLVGTLDRFNNAKKVEVGDRVKHG